eukprot:1161669-Pelagomonas_calceolata.AAC.3
MMSAGLQWQQAFTILAQASLWAGKSRQGKRQETWKERNDSADQRPLGCNQIFEGKKPVVPVDMRCPAQY